MKRFLQALALTCVLSGVVLAGDIPTVGAPAPPPPASSEMQSSSVMVTVILTIISIVAK